MGFVSSFSPDHLQSYFRIIQEGLAVRQHRDLLKWLQGETQHYLPHQIMLAAWGDFSSGSACYDIISPLPGVRTVHLEPSGLSDLLCELYNRWVELGKMPFASNLHQSDLGEIFMLHASRNLHCSFGKALQGMRSALLHGIGDRRGPHDCLYIIFSSEEEFDHSALVAMEVLLPYIDTALRRVNPLPRFRNGENVAEQSDGEHFGLSERETEIMDWVKKGKTNAEIGSILCISSYTVKNHLHQIFRKLDVYNRMQAASKIERGADHGSS
jgi:transcriptional regulator EpsA